MMFNYTDTVQHIFESYSINRDDTLTNKQVIENGRPLLFDFDYPMFDENYKTVFETNFIRNFYIRQIGFESYGLFKFQLESWLNINMPYFNKLFESEMIEYDPLVNFKVEETTNKNTSRNQDESRTSDKTRNTNAEATINKEQTVTGTSTESGASNSENESATASTTTGSSENSKTNTGNNTLNQDNFNRDLETDTPQNRLAITTEDGSGVIEYASKIKESSDKNRQTANSTSTDTGNESSTVDSDSTTSDTAKVTTSLNGSSSSNEDTNTSSTESEVNTENQSNTFKSEIKTVDDYVTSRIGKTGSQSIAVLINDYRNSLLRVERQIFKEMNELFMLLY